MTFDDFVNMTMGKLQQESCGDCHDCDGKDAGLAYFSSVLQEAFDQVASGKGAQRHAGGQQLLDQPWLAIAKTAGNGFLTGQAIKKLMEASSLLGTEGYPSSAFERELLGAIAYTAFAVMHKRLQDEQDSH